MKAGKSVEMRGIAEKAARIVFHLFCLAAIFINLVPFFDNDDSLMDFGSFYASGLKANNGENPYDPNSEYIFDINFSRVGAGGKMMNLNPPISVVLFRVLPQFDPNQSLVLWQAVSAILYGGILLTLARQYEQHITPVKFAWALTLAGFWHTLVLGQIYILLLLFTVPGWIFLKKGKFVAAGLAIGLLIAIKPNFMIWAIFLLVSGYYVTFLAAAVSSLVISLIPIM
ncbi:MAG TPA: glycosyltransferase family 87 protein, partial [Anaerolineales bacterium]|nr:glycosyltransferase family 87 protein [Anaerolineales bacterium]